MGQRDGFAAADINRINKMYACDAAGGGDSSPPFVSKPAGSKPNRRPNKRPGGNGGFKPIRPFRPFRPHQDGGAGEGLAAFGNAVGSVLGQAMNSIGQTLGLSDTQVDENKIE